MALYLISYDLRKPGRDYATLLERLRQLKAERVLESVWLLPSGVRTTEQVRNELWQLMDNNDRILVTRIAFDAAWNNLKLKDESVEVLYGEAR
jgi:hypothetical protein